MQISKIELQEFTEKNKICLETFHDNLWGSEGSYKINWLKKIKQFNYFGINELSLNNKINNYLQDVSPTNEFSHLILPNQTIFLESECRFLLRDNLKYKIKFNPLFSLLNINCEEVYFNISTENPKPVYLKLHNLNTATVKINFNELDCFIYFYLENGFQQSKQTMSSVENKTETPKKLQESNLVNITSILRIQEPIHSDSESLF
jgi:hypothetical protein